MLTLGFRLLLVILGIGVNILTARLLGAEGRGLFATATLVGALGITFFGGIAQSVSVTVAKRRDLSSIALSQSFILGLVFSIISFAVLSIWFFLFSRQDYLIYAALVLLPSLLFTYISGYFLGTGKINQYNTLNFFQVFFTFIFLGINLLLFRWGLKGALIGWISAYVVSCVIAFRWVRKEVQPFCLTPEPGILRQEASFGFKIGGTNLVSLLNYRLNIFLIGSYLGMGEVGIYSVAATLAESLWFFSSSLSLASFSRYGAVGAGEAAGLTAKGMRHLVLIIGLSGIFLFVFSGWIIYFIFGEAYLSAVKVLRFLLPGVAVYSLASIFSNYFTVQKGRPEISFYTCVFSTALGASLNSLLILTFGLEGAAIGTSITYFITMGIALTYLAKETSIPLKEFLFIKRKDLGDYKALCGEFLKYRGKVSVL